MYKFTIPNKSTYLLDINVKTFSRKSKSNNIHVLNTEYTDILNKNKDKIEKYYNNNLWDKMKKISRLSPRDEGQSTESHGSKSM